MLYRSIRGYREYRILRKYVFKCLDKSIRLSNEDTEAARKYKIRALAEIRSFQSRYPVYIQKTQKLVDLL